MFPSAPQQCLGGRMTSSAFISSSSFAHRPLRYAVLGAGFAGLSVAWHLLKESPKEIHLHIDMYDEVGIGGGASGVSGGLLHPYSPKDYASSGMKMYRSLLMSRFKTVKLLWKGAECWEECVKLLAIAEAAAGSVGSESRDAELFENFNGFIVRRRGILRPATNVKTFDMMNDNAQNSLASCRIETLDKDAAGKLVPDLCLPLNSAFYMPEALNINPQRYLQALFAACQNLAQELSNTGHGEKTLSLHKKSILKLREFEDAYDAVVICLGAKATMLPELSGRLPLRTCRGVVLQLQLSPDKREEYPVHGPSILSDAWLAVQGSRKLYMGSTWDWMSRNCSDHVSEEEASRVLQELLPKASAVFPGIAVWSCVGARAGLRAMPPLTPDGSVPLLGCINDLICQNLSCRYWFFGGLGSRGLLYHGWLGKLLASAILSSDEHLLPQEVTSWKLAKMQNQVKV